MKIQKLTVGFLLLVLGTIGLAFATRNQATGDKSSTGEAVKQREKKENSL